MRTRAPVPVLAIRNAGHFPLLGINTLCARLLNSPPSVYQFQVHSAGQVMGNLGGWTFNHTFWATFGEQMQLV